MKTVSQLAMENGLHRTTLLNAIWGGRFPVENYGRFYLIDESSPEWIAYIAGCRSCQPRVPMEYPDLTTRELEVLQQLWDDISDKDIADALCISINTVRFHLRNIYRKIGVRNRKGAIAYAVQKGIIS